MYSTQILNENMSIGVRFNPIVLVIFIKPRQTYKEILF